MHTFSAIEASTPEAFYGELARQAAHLMEGERDAVANLANVSALLNMHLADINWVGFYLWSERDQELVLGPFQGKPACIRIPMGKGVCGTAAQLRAPVVVPDVLQFPGHIACDAASRSEVVVPMVQGGRLIGVLDIDSPTPGRFRDTDAEGLGKVVAAITAATEFPAR
ncbi:GAF domain-containing protein [Alicyclobacillus sp.]|uniref:GAF domain-containing protein n=1 Tax=Alicyclobacillus sp. TaxID=61169 RepID=UPI0025C0F7F3|nr:GAF domain-containing protein [Alicyclobacillus sp.]MCL6515448.1 GAF domain-containing protein [Alicyclobacillus sp.]